MFQTLTSLAETVLTNVVHAAWQAGLLALIVLAFTWLLRSRLQPRWRFALWLVVFARLRAANSACLAVERVSACSGP